MSDFYADIIIDIVHQDLDKTFQYRIPGHLIHQIKIGMPVEVPFGKGNTIRVGYIINITQKPSIHPSKIKEIQQLIQNKTTIETELIQLAFWMSQRYGATTMASLKAVLPIQQKVKHKENKYVHLIKERESVDDYLQWVKQRKYKAMERLIEHLIQNPVLALDYIKTNLKISSSTLNRLIEEDIIKLTSEEVFRKPHSFQQNIEESVELSQEQDFALQTFTNDYESKVYKTYVLHGVTGSGKTEVYMRMIHKVLSIGKQAIVLIPEIALTYQTVKRFYERFGSKVGVLHSKLSQGERYDQYIQAKEGHIKIMIGPRSALFTPFSNLGLIIIDEEHETTYKSETQPKYHAKEVAIKRAELANASVVLGSATPSLETYYEALKGTYKLIELNNRIDHKALPSVDIVDMRQELLEGNKSMLSDRLRTAIEDRLSKKEQIILFINRRGFARFVSCRNCGCALKCDHCDVAYTYHNTGQLVCHYCGKEINVPSICPECGSKHIRQFGIGTQKVEAYIQSEFKEAKILRMDMDTTSKKNSYEDILTKFSRQEADVLIGTQMVAKGHDFPNVTLVGILAADLSLYMNDFRSSERTFNLLTQVAGRAGRGKIPGEVVVQTYSPEHFSIECAKTQDYKKFYNEEIQYREFMNYPPYSNIMTLLMTSKNENELIRGSELIGKAIEFTLDPSSYEIIGPTAAAIGKINDVYRRILYIKSKEYDMLLKGKKQIETILNQYKQYNSINIQFDFNPLFT